MEWVLILCALLCIAAILGSFLPFLPGPPLAWVAILIVHLTDTHHWSFTFLILTAIVTVVIELLDYFLPVWMTQKSGGTRYGQRGALAGMIIGLFVGGPFGLIFGPVIGAFIGELLHNFQDTRKAFRAALYSFIGFLLTTGFALIWSCWLSWKLYKVLPWKELLS